MDLVAEQERTDLEKKLEEERQEQAIIAAASKENENEAKHEYVIRMYNRG